MLTKHNQPNINNHQILNENSPFKAITLDAGFMIALSAVIGLLMGLAVSAISMMTTCEVSPTFSLTHMNLSLSMVRVANEMLATFMPTDVN